MRILIKYASRGRKDRFMDGLNNIYATIKTNDFQIICSFDESDTVMNDPDIQRTLNDQKNLKYFYGPDEGKIGAINRDVDKADEWDVLINFSDDMRFTGFAWDTLLEKIIKQYWPSTLDFFVHLWDGYVPIDTPLTTMSIIGREYYNRDKYIYYPKYKSFSCDAEAMYVALMRGCHKYILLRKRDNRIYNKITDFALFKHEHPAWNMKVKSDSVYESNGSFGDFDTNLYFSRMENLFDIKDAKPDTIYFDPITKQPKPIPSETFIFTA